MYHNYWTYTLESVHCSKRSHPNQKPVQPVQPALHLESSPHLPQLEKSPAATKAQDSQKKKKTGFIHYEQLKFIPEMQSWFNIQKLTNITSYVNTWLYQLIQKKSFGKIQYLFMIKTLKNKGGFPQWNKGKKLINWTSSKF